jgi:hypothetical protein
MKKVLLTLIMGMFLFSFASALPQVGNNTNVTVVCINNGYCSVDSICNINIRNPDWTFAAENVNMTRFPSQHKYNFTPQQSGRYCVSGVCEDDLSGKIDFCFDVTTTGEDVDISSKNVAFLISVAILTILSLLLAWLAFKLEIDIVKVGLIAFSVLIMVFNIGFTLNIMEDTLGSANASYNSFANIYIVAIVLAAALTIGLILWLIVIGLKVYKIKRGLLDE